jgi:DNA-binding transcriptional MocR family regulator
LQYKLLAAKEQIAISGSVLDEELCKQVLLKKEELLPTILADLGRKLAIVTVWLQKNVDIIACAMPEGGSVCFPRIGDSVDIGDVADFYRQLFEETGTIVGPGHWFARDDRSFRLGFGWPSVEDLECGLTNIETTIRRLHRRDTPSFK